MFSDRKRLEVHKNKEEEKFLELSVIVPVYNVQDYISKTLSSLTGQTKQNFEIIIVDDGSKDDSCRIAEKMLAESSFSDYQIIKKANGGVSSARNVGIQAANGAYVFFLDGDDYVAADFVERVYATIENQSPDVVCWAYDRIDQEGKVTHAYTSDWPMEPSWLTGAEALEAILVLDKLSIWNGSALYRKEVLNNNGIRYTEGCINGEDQEFTFKALSKSDKVVFVDQVLSYYLQRDSSISFSYNPKRMDVVGALDRSAAYLRGNQEVSETVIKVLTEDNLLKEYVTNFFSCIIAQKKNRSVSTKEAFSVVMSDIQVSYPGLHGRVRNAYKKGTDLSMADKMKYLLFFYFPIQYFNLITRKYEIKGTI